MKNRFLKMSLSLLMMIGILNSVSANTPEYKIVISNKETDTNGQTLLNGVYTVTQTEGGYSPSTNSFLAKTLDPFTITIAENGLANLPTGVTGTFVDGVVTLKVPEGSYTLTQTKAPVGFYRDKSEIKLHLPATNPDLTSLSNTVTITPKFNKILKNVTLTKLSDNVQDEFVPDAQFKLYRSATEVKPDLSAFTEYTPAGTVTTNAQGQITINNLPYGFYYLQEIGSPATHVLSDEKYEFKVFEEATNGANEELNLAVSAKNYRIPTIDKIIDDKPNASVTDPHIANQGDEVAYTVILRVPVDIASYQTYHLKDTMAGGLTYKSHQLPEHVTANFINTKSTDKVNEEMTLEFDVATLEQFAGQEIPIHYVLTVDDDTAPATAMPNNAKITYANQYGHGGDIENDEPPVVKTPSSKISITKVDAKNEQLKLEGVEFQLYLGASAEEVNKGNGTLIATKETDAQGLAIFEGLKNGKYYLKETKTIGPKGDEPGYKLLDKLIEIEVNNTTKDILNVQKTVHNWKTNTFLPTTGTQDALLIATAGSIFVCLGIFLFKKSNEKKHLHIAK